MIYSRPDISVLMKKPAAFNLVKQYHQEFLPIPQFASLVVDLAFHAVFLLSFDVYLQRLLFFAS